MTDMRDEWRLIDSAPKDGRTVIGWHCEWGEPTTVDWAKGEHGEGWYMANMFPRFPPTHWMPLPEPPKMHEHERKYCPPEIEDAAKLIYERLPYDGPPGTTKPAWVPFGNSLKQVEAREMARASREGASAEKS